MSRLQRNLVLPGTLAHEKNIGILGVPIFTPVKICFTPLKNDNTTINRLFRKSSSLK